MKAIVEYTYIDKKVIEVRQPDVVITTTVAALYIQCSHDNHCS